MKILLKSAKIIDQNSSFHHQIKDILIENGKIIQIADSIVKPEKYKEIILENLHISNGWFDTSVSLGEPGFEERETIENGLLVAAKSGFTAIALNPNTHPVIDNKSAVEFLIQKSSTSAVALFPIANLTQKAEGKELSEMYDMQNSGAIAFGDYNKAIDNANLMKIALLYAQNFDALVLSFPQDNSIGNLGYVNESENTTRLGLKSLPNLSEELQISRDLFLLEYTGGKLHIPTVTTAKALQLIRNAKKRGLDVTCSVSAHHMVLTDEELKNFDSNFKVTPPLRSVADIKAIVRGINDGTIEMITSDHNPLDIEHKKVEFENAAFGTIGLESLFGSVNKIIHLDQLIVCLTENPRKRFGLPATKIEPGEKANLTLFNPDFEHTFTKDYILSKSKNAIFLDKKLNGISYGIISDTKMVLR